MKRRYPWEAKGYTFSLQPPWPYGYEPQPYEPKREQTESQRANLSKGREVTNRATGTKFYTISDFDPSPMSDG